VTLVMTSLGRSPSRLIDGTTNGMVTDHAGVAQLVEHQLPKLRVVGSSPIARFHENPAQAGVSFQQAEIAEIGLLSIC
jgi:hypothetical protein